MEDNIWWTRKARINSEKRLLSNQRWMDLLLLWYSLSAVFVSVWLLAYKTADQQLTSVVFTCFSIFILGVSLFGSNSRFAQRAAQFKDNYIALHQLYFSVSAPSEFQQSHREEYSRLLNIAENHEEIDHVRAVIST